jgi:hypothetical protein
MKCRIFYTLTGGVYCSKCNAFAECENDTWKISQAIEEMATDCIRRKENEKRNSGTLIIRELLCGSGDSPDTDLPER